MGGSPKASAQCLAGETSLLGTTRSPTAVARAPTTSGEIAISEIETKKTFLDLGSHSEEWSTGEKAIT